MLDDESEQPVQLMGSKPMGLREPDGFKPELRNSVAMFDVNVRGLRSLETVEKEPKAGDPQNSRHRASSSTILKSRTRFGTSEARNHT
jgi:hypothetical protein